MSSPHPDVMHLQRVRLPRWLLGDAWPTADAQPALADIHLTDHGTIHRIVPHGSTVPATEHAPGATWDLQGALALPGLVDAHTHLDKAFTLPRMGEVRPGLLGAIDAMMADRQGWTEADVRTRASRALEWAWRHGVRHLRTHCDWWEPAQPPLAWHVLRELAETWAPRLRVERVSLIPLHLYTRREDAMALAATVARAGPGTLLGGFVHSTNWDPAALQNLLEAAATHDLDVDLHVDEELHPDAQGLATTAGLLRRMDFGGRVVCGHTCALAVLDEATALATLDAVAQAPITMVTLPITNLLLQDAVTGRTPRQRGLTLIKEARARGIPLLMASDNVQDPFCPVGSFDPLEAFGTGVLAAQLGQPFDNWSDTLCRTDWLTRQPSATGQAPLQPGQPADLLLFTEADYWGFPSRTAHRVVLRQGRLTHGALPTPWVAPITPPSWKEAA